MSYHLRLYNLNDKDALMGIFRSNMPHYFDPSELEPFRDFLADIKGTYFVCVENNKQIGAGGYYETEKGEARICWLMVDGSMHGKGIGRFMMQEFYNKIKQTGKSDRITLKTTQHTDKFYETLGYKTTQFEKDFWVKGLHLYFMEMKLNR